MKRSLSILLAASLCLAACQNIEELDVQESTGVILSAHIEHDEVTKTVLGESNNILWSEDDQIVAFMKNSFGHKYQIQSSFVGKTYAKFSKISSVSGDDLSASMEWDHNVAYYPYSESIECVKSGDNYTLDLVLPAEQTYAENSFGNGYFPMVAVSEDNDITFKNILGALKLQLKGTQTVKSIKVTGTNDEILSGTAVVTAYTNNLAPAITMTATDDASKSVTLNCTDGVQLSEGTVTEFIIALPPVVFTEGFIVIITDSKDNEHLVTSDRENEVLRSSLLVMPEVTLVSSGDEPELPAGEAVNLSQSGTANSYIVSQKGAYKFSTVKGNSSESVGVVASAEVLWETFGTNVTPNVGDLVKNTSYSDGYITFQTADTFKEGNAVIAAKDASGNILWSWHIWLTDQPEEHVYYNNAGTVMDRNLGATSATPGDVCALGLLYQWGRKDPFLGSSSISSNTLAMSTITWPSAVSSSNGTIEYSISNPTTFIYCNTYYSDWFCEGDALISDIRWTSSETTKSIYDPCPAGWRVPDGGGKSLWATALDSSSSYTVTYDSINKGINFSGIFGSEQEIWYPASYSLYYYDGSLNKFGGYYCSASTGGISAYDLYFNSSGHVSPSSRYERGNGYFVRCVQEEFLSSIPPDTEAVNLSKHGTANSYIVSQKGEYTFMTVKGNSNVSIGAVESVEVLWESFGTYVRPNVGDLVKNISYSNDYITFETADTFKKGNAVIAAKDALGTILWSWHIWFTDEPQGQVYYYNAGIMMDRNLGATSATPGDTEAHGLLYQWGRKDPFLGSAISTITWPSSVKSDLSKGTKEYAIAHPTTFITSNVGNYDWLYPGTYSTSDNLLWSESSINKYVYDPCPVGWRVPDGGDNGIWAKANGLVTSINCTTLYNNTDKGINFSGIFGDDATIWYPASGYRSGNDGRLCEVDSLFYLWSASASTSTSTSGTYSYYLNFYTNNYVYMSLYNTRAHASSVRCVRE